MSGIYVHIPYCKKKCDYCDFYSVVSAEGKNNFVSLIQKELSVRSDYLPEGRVETIYFGGGTPSLLSADQISELQKSIGREYSISPDTEVTLEANPDDLNPEYLNSLRSLGINRLSIGVQSFSDVDLIHLGRRHNAAQAIDAVRWAHQAGFENISIDLIYGLPYSSTEIWKANLQKAFELPVKHLSCYHLIYEEGTPLFRKYSRGTVIPVGEEESVEQFELLQQFAHENDFIHYEISNLAKEGYFSRHNTSYWKQIPYLGLGPSAHSYNGITRDWNPKSVELWANALQKGNVSCEKETLTEKDKLNDYLLTSLRTIWGANIEKISDIFGDEVAKEINAVAQKYIDLGLMENRNGVLLIHPRNFITSDGIIADFLRV